jgi:hypothetical protein
MAQNISSAVYPTDEEIYEAFLLGDIDYHTYRNLTEIIRQGIDSFDLFLLEEIPNLNFHSDIEELRGSAQEREQAEPFEKRGDGSPEFIRLRTRRLQNLEQTGGGENQYYFSSRLPSRWTFDARADENFDQNLSMRFRALKYQDVRGVLKRMIVGNFAARYGLGLSVGYRGRILNEDAADFGESIIFPDYGGFNGLYVEGGRRTDAVKLLLHFDKNALYRMQTTAVNFMKRIGNFQAETVVLSTALKNRATLSEFSLKSFGAFVGYNDKTYNIGLELAFPENSSGTVPAALFETKYNSIAAKLRLSCWDYGADFINIAGGGRSGDYYRKIAIEEIDLNFDDRRNDQKGFLLKGISALTNGSSFDLSFTAYGRDRYEKTLATAALLDIPLTSSGSLRPSYEYSEKLEKGERKSSHKGRIEHLIKRADIFLRNSLGYAVDKSQKKYLSIFSRAKIKFKFFKKLELWINFDKINLETGRLDYFYGYLRETLAATKNLEMGVKYSYRYNRGYDDPGSSKFLFDLEMIL